MKLIILILIFAPLMATAAMKTTKYHKDGTQTVDFGEFKDPYQPNNKVTSSCRYESGREVSTSNSDYAACVGEAFGTQRMNSLERGSHRFEARTGGSDKFEFQLGR